MGEDGEEVDWEELEDDGLVVGLELGEMGGVSEMSRPVVVGEDVGELCV